MLIVALQSLLLAAAPVSIMAPGLKATGIAAEKVAFLSEVVSSQLELAGMSVTTEKQLSTVIGLERQKELMGCKEDAAQCMAELASAMGTEAVLIGDVALFGTRFVGNLKIIRAKDGKSIAVRQFESKTEDALLDDLKVAAAELAQAARVALRGASEGGAPAAVSSQSGRALPLATGGLGVVGVIAGCVLLGLASSKYSLLTSGTNVSRADADAALQSGPSFTTGGAAALGLGVAVVVVGVVWWLLTSDSPASAGLWPDSTISHGLVRW